MSTPPPIPANLGPIVGASRLSYQDCIATVPSVRETVLGWLRPITVGVVSTTIDGTGQATEITRQQLTAGCVQPLQDREIKIYAEGERAWGYYALYLTPDLLLKADDKVIYKGVTYRIMAKKDWGEYGYVRYVLVEAYQG